MSSDATSTRVDTGLSSAQVGPLRAQWGANTVPEQRSGVLARVAGGLWAPVPWMLEATIVLEALLGKWLDAGIVAAVLVLNAAVGLIQPGCGHGLGAASAVSSSGRMRPEGP